MSKVTPSVAATSTTASAFRTPTNCPATRLVSGMGRPSPSLQ